jgi:anti-sigma factor RsiW
MHLSDEHLNEYLDEALAPEVRGRADSHLAACPECAARLAGLRAVFARIESLPEAPLSRDLAPSVRRALDRRAALPRWLRLTAGLEAAGAVAALALAAPVLAEFADSLASTVRPPSWAELAAQLQGQWTVLLQSIPEFPVPELPVFPLEVSSVALTLTALGAFVFWVVGNGLLLKRMVRTS